MVSFRYALHLAGKVGGKVVVLNVVESPFARSGHAAADEEKLANEVQHKLDQACHFEAAQSEDVETMVRLAVESVSEEIILAARDVAADLIVVPTSPRSGFRHALFANTVDKIERHAPCAVLSVPFPPPAGSIEDCKS